MSSDYERCACRASDEWDQAVSLSVLYWVVSRFLARLFFFFFTEVSRIPPDDSPKPMFEAMIYLRSWVRNRINSVHSFDWSDCKQDRKLNCNPHFPPTRLSHEVTGSLKGGSDFYLWYDWTGDCVLDLLCRLNCPCGQWMTKIRRRRTSADRPTPNLSAQFGIFFLLTLRKHLCPPLSCLG